MTRRRGPERREAVDHPTHYGGRDNPYEAIKVIRAWLTPEQCEGFLVGNALKYLARAGKKGEKLEDVKKTVWYLLRLVEKLEAEAGAKAKTDRRRRRRA